MNNYHFDKILLKCLLFDDQILPGIGSTVPAPKRANTSAAVASSRDVIRRNICGDCCSSSLINGDLVSKLVRLILIFRFLSLQAEQKQ